MKRFFIILFTTISTYFIFVSNNDGSPVAKTNAPGENHCGDPTAIGCHTTARLCNFTSESSKMSITLNGSSTAKFKFDSTYEIALTLPISTGNLFGFQAIVKNKWQNKIGTFLAGTNVQILAGGYSTHLLVDPNNIMKFKWTAPSKDTSAMNVTLYVCAVQGFFNGNPNRTSEFDSVYAKTLVLTADTAKIDSFPVSISSFNSTKTFSIHPTAVSNFVNINAEMMNMNYEIFNISGIKMIHGNIESTHLDIAKLEQGIYYLVVDNKVAKFIKE